MEIELKDEDLLYGEEFFRIILMIRCLCGYPRIIGDQKGKGHVLEFSGKKLGSRHIEEYVFLDGRKLGCQTIFAEFLDEVFKPIKDAFSQKDWNEIMQKLIKLGDMIYNEEYFGVVWGEAKRQYLMPRQQKSA